MGVLSCAGTGDLHSPRSPSPPVWGLLWERAAFVLNKEVFGKAGFFIELFSILDGSLSPGPQRPEPVTGW